MINVLFVCLGNICRSPIAEEVFRQLVRERGLQGKIKCDSAGTASYHTGSLPDRRMRKVAQERGLQLTHNARQLCYEDFIGFEYIMTMDESNFANVQKESYRVSGSFLPENQLFLYRMFDPLRAGSLLVPDPYYDEIDAFRNVYEIVSRSGVNLLNWIIEEHSLDAGLE